MPPKEHHRDRRRSTNPPPPPPPHPQPQYNTLQGPTLPSLPPLSPPPLLQQSPPPPPPPPSQTSTSLKRPAPPSSTTGNPAKKQSKWTPEEDALIIALRCKGEKWDDISTKLPGRSAISCRLHYQNYLERRSEWDEERKNRLSLLYERFKADMWKMVAKEMEIPWRAVEAMAWELGEHEMCRRANVKPFSLSSVALDASGSKKARARRKSASPMPESSDAQQQLRSPSLGERPAVLPPVSELLPESEGAGLARR